MARQKILNTRQVYLRLAEDAADLLDELAPSENKRGEYVSELLRQAAARAPNIPARATGAGRAALTDRAAIERQLHRLAVEMAALTQQLLDLADAPGGADALLGGKAREN